MSKVVGRIAEIWIDSEGRFGTTYVGEHPDQGGLTFGWGTGPASRDIKLVLTLLEKQLPKHREVYLKRLIKRQDSNE